MSGPLLLGALAACVAWLLVRDARERAVSAGVWIAVGWAIVYASRPVTSWFGSTDAATDVFYDEGNPTEALIYFGLLLAGLAVLLRRRVRLPAVIRDHPWLAAFWIFWLASVLWSDYPVITLKRWVKDAGNVVIVLVILTERDPLQAMKAVFTRCAYVCIPLSVLLIRHFPELGRVYGGWNRDELMYVGVATHKNSLGTLALVSALFLLWDLLESRGRRAADAGPRAGTAGVAARVVTLAMCWYLLRIANSATSLACAVAGSALLAALWVPGGRTLLPRLVAPAVIAFVSLNSVFDVTASIALALGRDPTLTTRTDIWPILMQFQSNTLLGAGFNTFWSGHRLVQLRDAVGGIIQAHNGYLETYLSGGVGGVGLLALLLLSAHARTRQARVLDTPAGRIAFVLVLVAIIYNFSEASFNKLNLLWFATVLGVMGYRVPVPAWRRAAVPTSRPVLAAGEP